MRALGRPGVAAVTFDERGGGIAAVSRLIRDALEAGATQPCRVFPLVRASRDGAFPSTTIRRLGFGFELAAAQSFGLCDWVCFTHLSLATVQRLVPGPVRRPYVVYLHDVEAWAPLPPARGRILAGATLRLSNSAFTASRVVDANPGAGAVLPCAPGLPRTWQPGIRSRQLPWGPHAVVTVGRMIATERYKGHDQLLEAWPAVVAAIPDAHLVCVGEGDDVPRLRAKAVAIGVGARVSFAGFVTEATRQQVYGDAAVFAMPSRREGFGLVYLEAMASGLPCVASVHDAAREVVVDGETGYLVSQEDTAGVSGRIVSLLRDEARRRAMGEAGRRRVAAQFTFDAFTARFEERLVAAGVGPRQPAASLAAVGR